MNVDGGEREHHQEGRQDEENTYQSCSDRPCLCPAEIHCQLRCQWAWGQLREGQSLHVILPGHPAPLFHQVALHVAVEGDRAAEAHRAEPEEAERKVAQCGPVNDSSGITDCDLAGLRFGHHGLRLLFTPLA